MNHRIPQANEVGFGPQGPKSKMAAMFVRGFSNFFPIAPILVILVSKVYFWGAANPMSPFLSPYDKQGCQFWPAGLPDYEFWAYLRVLFITLVLIDLE